MSVDEFKKINWLAPWHFSEPGLEEELTREVSSEHTLYQIEAISVGRRQDNDDVLFFLPNHTPPLAVIHLTWNIESNPKIPRVRFFESIEDFTENRMKRDNNIHFAN